MLSAAPVALDAAEPSVRFRVEVTGTSGTTISAVEAGNEFSVDVYAVDQRPVPHGVFAAYLDLLFDDSRVVRSGDVTFGEAYTNALALGGAAPGILDEVGALASWSDIGDGTAVAPEWLLFRAPFRAIDPGPVRFLTEPADRLPDSHVLLFGLNQPINQRQIVFETVSLDITPSTASAATFPPTIALPATDFSGVAASRLPSTLLSGPSLTVSSTFNRGIEDGDERWRLRERSPTDRLSPPAEFEFTPQTAENESGWIELPFQTAPAWRPLSLPASSYRESLLRHDANERYQVFSFNSRTGELTSHAVQLNSRQPGWTRAFFRMNWSFQQVTSLSSKELLAAQMIDIDEILTGAVRLELPESNLNEFFAEGLGDETNDALTDECAELLRSDIPLRAARGASLAIEVGMASSEPAVAEHSHVPDENADGEQADAAPPTPPAGSGKKTAASA